MQPLQLLLFIPFARLGIALLKLENLRFSLEEIIAMFKADWLEALHMLWQVNLVAVVAWAILAVPIGAVIYFVMLPIFRRFIPATNILKTDKI